MSFTLDEIPNALPEKRLASFYGTSPSGEVRMWTYEEQRPWNMAIDAQSAIRLEIDRETIKKVIATCWDKNIELGFGGRKSLLEMDSVIADALCAAGSKIIKVIP